MKYDLAVAYRIYPAVSKPAAGLPFGDDKLCLSEICLRTLVASLGSLRAKFWVLLDGCPDSYEEIFRRHIRPKDLVLLRLDPPVGNRGTFARQVDILLQQDCAPFVYFAEDDYLYVPNEFPALLDFLSSHDDVHFVSPYDHPDCYRLYLHRTPKWLRLDGSRHWRTASSTCLTFLTRKETLEQYESVFTSYSRGNDDCALWLSLTKNRVFNPFCFARHFLCNEFYWKILLKAWLYCPWQLLFGRRSKLWVPVPGIATHLDKNGLSSGVDWLSLIRQQLVAELCDR
jgi:hypothetical protein